jgi:hypothetical protein
LTVPYRYNLAAVSPFIKHPTDVSLPAAGEYTAYKGYKLSAPVARLKVPVRASISVAPGSDVAMCISCHVAYASNYPDMLRWGYSTMIAGNTGTVSGTGCFACHTTTN